MVDLFWSEARKGLQSLVKKRRLVIASVRPQEIEKLSTAESGSRAEKRHFHKIALHRHDRLSEEIPKFMTNAE
jgi:hypothetical protein